MRVLLIWLLLALSGVAGADTYRCDDRLGRGTVFQNDPCPGGTFQRDQRLVTPAPPQLFFTPEPREILAKRPVRVVPLAPMDQVVLESGRR